MTLYEGETVLLKNGKDHRAEIVGIRRTGYDIARFPDQKIIRNVPRERLQKIS